MARGDWQAVYDLVRAGPEDYGVLEDPPRSDVELGHVAETVTDHVVAGVRLWAERPGAGRRWWRRG